MAELLKPGISSIQATRLVSTDQSAPGEVTFLFEHRVFGGRTEMSPLTLRQVGDQWKVKLPVLVNDQPR